MPAVCNPLTITKGKTFREAFRIREDDGTYRDLTGKTARMHIRDGVDNEDIYLELTTENDRITLDASGYITLIISADDTLDLEELDGLVYDLDLIDDEVTAIAKGPVYVVPGVTR